MCQGEHHVPSKMYSRPVVGPSRLQHLPSGGAAHASGPRPLFQLPVACGEVWRLATYIGHDDFDIDMHAHHGGAWGRPIRASYAGQVIASGIDGTLGGRTPSNPQGPMGNRRRLLREARSWRGLAHALTFT